MKIFKYLINKIRGVYKMEYTFKGYVKSIEQE